MDSGKCVVRKVSKLQVSMKLGDPQPKCRENPGRRSRGWWILKWHKTGATGIYIENGGLLLLTWRPVSQDTGFSF